MKIPFVSGHVYRTDTSASLATAHETHTQRQRRSRQRHRTSTCVCSAAVRVAICDERSRRCRSFTTDCQTDQCMSIVAEKRSLPVCMNTRLCQEKTHRAFPSLTFDGPVHYLTERIAVEEWCRHIPHGTPIGFDTEWKPCFRRDEVPNKTALIQLCFEHRGEHVHIS